MYINHFAGFRKFWIENYEYPKTLTKKYLGQSFYWDGSQFPITNPGGVRFVNANGDKTFLQASTFIGIDPKFAKNLQAEPKDNDIVPVIVGNKADPKIKTQSNTAHGEPNEAAGESFDIPYAKFLFLIQMPQAASGAGAGGMPPGGALPGGGAPMSGGSMPPPSGGALPGGSPPGGLPMGAPGSTPPGAPPM